MLSFSLTEVLVWSRRHCHLPLVGKKLKERSDNVSTDIHFLICIYSDIDLYDMYWIKPFVSAGTNILTRKSNRSVNNNKLNRYLVKLIN